MNLYKVRPIKAGPQSGNTTAVAPGIMLEPDSSPVVVQTDFNIPSNSPTVRGPVSPTTVNATGLTRANTAPGIISLIENYNSWVQSPILNNIYKDTIKIPHIHLKESRLAGSTLFQQFKYFTHYKFFGRTSDVTGDVFGQDSKTAEIIEQTGKFLRESYEAIGRAADFVSVDLPDILNIGTGDPYDGIYNLASTGFEYILPFFTRDVFQKTSMYGDTYSGDAEKQRGQIEVENEDGVKQEIDTLEIIRNFAESNSQGIRAFAEPGLYIEKPKFYEFGQNPEQITFSFPLLNTQSIEQITQNYQFIFLLTFQNSMFRKDRAAFIPPCIYEVLIPGIRYMKYAYVSELEIDFLGTRRMVDVVAPNLNGNTQLNTIIPEAYNVKITLAALHEESANFLYRSAADSFDGVQILTNNETII
jgi:hypothetical protein